MDHPRDRVSLVSMGPSGLEEGIVLLAPLGAAGWIQLAGELARFAAVRLVTYPAHSSWAALRSGLDAIAISRLHLIVAGPITRSEEFAVWLRHRQCMSHITVGEPGLLESADLVVGDTASLAEDVTIREFLQRVVAID